MALSSVHLRAARLSKPQGQKQAAVCCGLWCSVSVAVQTPGPIMSSLPVCVLASLSPQWNLYPDFCVFFMTLPLYFGVWTRHLECAARAQQKSPLQATQAHFGFIVFIRLCAADGQPSGFCNTPQNCLCCSSAYTAACAAWKLSQMSVQVVYCRGLRGRGWSSWALKNTCDAAAIGCPLLQVASLDLGLPGLKPHTSRRPLHAFKSEIFDS